MIQIEMLNISLYLNNNKNNNNKRGGAWHQAKAKLCQEKSLHQHMDTTPNINSEYKSPDILVKSNSLSKYVKDTIQINSEYIWNKALW